MFYIRKLHLIIFIFIVNINYSLASAPKIVCDWLPWCWTWWDVWWDWFFWFMWNIASEFIKYVSVISVIILVLAWINLLISLWEEEKLKSSKKIITYSLVWVILANSAWFLINLVNKINII